MSVPPNLGPPARTVMLEMLADLDRMQKEAERIEEPAIAKMARDLAATVQRRIVMLPEGRAHVGNAHGLW